MPNYNLQFRRLPTVINNQSQPKRRLF